MAGVIRVKDHLQDSNFAGMRETGEVIRVLMDEKIKMGQGVTLDFTDISMITQSFADEIVGIFTRAYGVDFIKANIRTVNANDDIRSILNFVVSYSKKKKEAA